MFFIAIRFRAKGKRPHLDLFWAFSGKRILVLLFSGVAFLSASAMGIRGIQAALTNAQSASTPVYCIQTQQKRIAITFDVEWNDRQIGEILEILKRQDAGATFFVTGRWVQTHNESLQKIAAAGCEIGNHSDTHPHMGKLSSEENRAQMDSCNRKVQDILGKTPKLFRSPYGEENTELLAAAEQANLRFIQWDVEAHHTKENGLLIRRSKRPL